jgi:hypothetical protein
LKLLGGALEISGTKDELVNSRKHRHQLAGSRGGGVGGCKSGPVDCNLDLGGDRVRVNGRSSG